MTRHASDSPPEPVAPRGHRTRDEEVAHSAMADLRIANVRLTTSSPEDVGLGLLGWVSCVLNGTVRLDGLTLRRTRHGRLTVSFPVRLDGKGRRHSMISPIDDRARRMIEREILAQLGFEQETSR
jgi:hypothetical protein